MAHVHSQGLLWSIPSRSRHRARGQLALAIRVLWGDDTLALRRLAPPRSFSVGDAPHSDFVLPPELGTLVSRRLVEVIGSSAYVVLATGERRPLAPGAPVAVALGQLTFSFELVSDEPRLPAAPIDAAGLGYFATSALSALGFMAALALFVPPLGLTTGDELDRERLDIMLQYLDASAERQRERERAGDAGQASAAPSTPSEASRGDAGKLGKANAPSKPRRFASNAAAGERDATRAEALLAAADFGLIGVLRSAAPLLPGALWDRDAALNPLDSVAFGNLFGQDIGEAAGNGLGVSGAGEGSGGRGLGIGMQGIGTCQSLTGCGGDGKGGFGDSVGHLGSRGHTATTPRIRSAATTLSGHLPPEVVQRVVRQNFGRFRRCYEDGLRKNPTLTGRVTARFVIDRTGAVSVAQNGGSDLPDSAVVACVLGAFYGLSFPMPEAGTVRVSYPILFSPG